MFALEFVNLVLEDDSRIRFSNYPFWTQLLKLVYNATNPTIIKNVLEFQYLNMGSNVLHRAIGFVFFYAIFFPVCLFNDLVTEVSSSQPAETSKVNIAFFLHPSQWHNALYKSLISFHS